MRSNRCHWRIGVIFHRSRQFEHREMGGDSARAAHTWRTRIVATTIRAGVTGVAASIRLAPTSVAILVLIGLTPVATSSLGARRNPSHLQDDQEPEGD